MKQMFPSHSSLFAKSQGSQDGFPQRIDGASDYSQLQNAQFSQFEMFSDNSQDCSQSFYSQNEDNSGSNSEGYRKVPVYEKYMAKPSLFGGRGRGRGLPQGRVNKNLAPNTSNLTMKGPGHPNNFQQQITSQKAKAKERDERDLLGSIVKMVKDCADEVKSSLTSFKDSDETKVEDIQSSVNMLMSSFEQSNNKILKAVEGKEDSLQRIHALERDLQKKEDEIKLLKQQQKNLSSIEDSYNMLLDKMRSFVGDQQHQMEQKLQHVVETSQEQLTIMKDLSQSRKLGLEDGGKNFQDMKYSNQRHLHDIEKRLINEIVQVRDDFDHQKRDMESFYRNQMQTFHQKQGRDLEQYLKTGIENVLQKSDFLTLKDIKESEAEIVSKSQNQHKQLENHLRLTTKQQSDLLLKQCQKHQAAIERKLTDSLASFRNQQTDFIKQNNTAHREIENARQMAWENENVPKHIQDQLNTLHSQHQSEIKRLEGEMKNQRDKIEEGVELKRNVAYGNLNTFNVYDPSKERTSICQTGPLFKKSIGFTSPKPLQGTRWNSRTIFGRANPSPVATVLPQRNPINLGEVRPDRNIVLPQLQDSLPQRRQISETLHHIPEPENDHDRNVADLQQPPRQTTSHVVSKKKATRKRKLFGGRKRRAKKGRQTSKPSENGTASHPVTECYAESDVHDDGGQFKKTRDVNNNNNLSRHAASVYNFNGNDEPMATSTQQTKLSDQLSQRSDYSTKTFSDESAGSSPSLSVTEVFITRRVHNDKVGVTGTSNHSNPGVGIFSSPKMLEMFNPNPGNCSMLTQHTNVGIPRKNEKRKLCDFDSHHTQVFQMIQCLQKKTY